VYYEAPPDFDAFEKKGKKHHKGGGGKGSFEGYYSMVERDATERHRRGEAAGLTYPASKDGYLADARAARDAIQDELDGRD